MNNSNDLISARALLLSNTSFIREVRLFEGFSSTPYYCPSGILTIGYGFTDKKYTKKKYISKQEAFSILLDILAALIVNLKKLYPNLSTNQYLALSSFCYNLGIHTLIDRRRLINGYLSLYNDNHSLYSLQRCVDCINQYVYSNGKKLDGLVKRRNYESKLFASSHACRV